MIDSIIPSALTVSIRYILDPELSADESFLFARYANLSDMRALQSIRSRPAGACAQFSRMEIENASSRQAY